MGRIEIFDDCNLGVSHPPQSTGRLGINLSIEPTASTVYYDQSGETGVECRYFLPITPDSWEGIKAQGDAIIAEQVAALKGVQAETPDAPIEEPPKPEPEGHDDEAPRS